MYTKRVAFSFVLVMLASMVSGQDVPVTLDKERVFDVRAGYGAWSTQLRAQSMENRIKEWADDPLRSDKIVVQNNETTTDLMVGDSPVITVFNVDAAAAGVSREQLARQWAASLETAVSQYRARYSTSKIALRIVLAFVTFALVLALLFLVRKATIRAEDRCVVRVASHARRGAGLTGAVAEGALGGWVRSLFVWIRWIVYALVILGGVQFLLLLSPRTRADTMQILYSVGASLTQLGWKVWEQIPSLILVAVIAGIAHQLLKVIHAVFRRVARGQIVFEGFRPRWASTTDRLVSIFIVVLAVLIAYPYIPGSSSPAFQGVSIFLGALVSLGSTGLVGNALAGIMLTYIEGFEVGDYVQIGDTSGIVTRAALMTTQVRTANHKTITLPNAIVMASAMVNYSAVRDKGTLVPLQVGIGYDAPWRQVEWLLLEAAARTPGVNRRTDPKVSTLSLNQFDVTYELDVFLEAGEVYAKVRSLLARNVLDLFNEAGVQIMTPAYEGNPDYAVLAPKWNPPSTTESTEGRPQATVR